MVVAMVSATICVCGCASEAASASASGAMVAGEADPVLGAQSLAQGEDEPRLADTGLAREQHDLALAVPGLPPAVEEQRQLLVAADERRARRAVERLEAALRRALAGHAEARARARRSP